MNFRINIKSFWIIAVFILSAGLGFSQERGTNKLLAGPEGVVILLNIDDDQKPVYFKPEETTTIYRALRNSKQFEKVGETHFPRTLDEFQKRVGKENLDALKLELMVSSDELLYRKILNNPLDSIVFLLIDYEFAEAFGLVYKDVSWAKGTAVDYRIERTDKNGQNNGQFTVSMDGIFPQYKDRYSLHHYGVSDSVANISWASSLPIKNTGAFIQANIYRKVGTEEKFKQIRTTMVSPSTNRDSSYISFSELVEPGQTYSYYAEITDWAGNKGFASDTLFAISYNASEVRNIANLSANGQDDGVLLSWDALPAHAIYSGIEIMKSRNYDSNYVVLDTLRASEIKYLDTRVLKGSAYFYKLKPVFVNPVDEGFIKYAETSGSVLYKEDSPAPSTPEGIKVQSVDKGIKIDWWTSDDLDIFGYYVLRGLTPNTMQIISGVVQDTVYVDSLVSGGFSGQMHYAIQAVNQNQQWSDTSQLVTMDIRQPLVITPPAGLTARKMVSGVSLLWNNVMEVDNNVSSYVVFRRLKGSEAFDVLNSEELLVPYYTDTTHVGIGEYEYAVSTRDLWGNYSVLSPSAVVHTSDNLVLNPPLEIHLRNLIKGIEVSWPVSLTDKKGEYLIYRKDEGKKTFVRIGKSPMDQVYLDTSITKGVAYEYRVVSSNGSKESEPSLSKQLRREL